MFCGRHPNIPRVSHATCTRHDSSTFGKEAIKMPPPRTYRVTKGCVGLEIAETAKGVTPFQRCQLSDFDLALYLSRLHPLNT